MAVGERCTSGAMNTRECGPLPRVQWQVAVEGTIRRVTVTDRTPRAEDPKEFLTAASLFCLSLAFIGVCLLEIFGIKIAKMQQLTHNPDWKRLYEAALWETDSSRLVEKIILARRAILERIEESLKEPVASEHQAMNEALRHLRRLAEMDAPSIAA